MLAKSGGFCFPSALAMDSLRHFPLGEPFPNSPHAVVSSLPTLADVRAYEEKEARVVEALDSGYPRFVQHRYVRDLVGIFLEREALAGRGGVLLGGQRAARALCEHIGRMVDYLEVEPGLCLVHYPGNDAETAERVGKYLQHVGCGISSRQAEDGLVALGRLKSRHAEAVFEGHAESEVERRLAELLGCRTSDVLVCASGMNAFFAGFRAVQEFQRGRGRKRWIQLGWLYLDSGCVLKEFAEADEELDVCYDVFDLDAILERIERAGKELAGVVVECPTNPQIQICQLEKVAAAVRRQGGVMMVDPTIASIYNVDVLPHADIVVTSLTKYAAIDGDVMIGALAVNPDSPFYGDLVLRTSAFHQPAYARDISRLACEMQAAPELVQAANANAKELSAFIRRHPAVARVDCANQSDYLPEVAKLEGPVGAVVTFSLKGSMEAFYDTVRCMKGPSFGTRFTLLCPFMYLAHYDLVSTGQGREFLAGVGIDPDLIRLSVGTEPVEAIREVLGEALDASLKH